MLKDFVSQLKELIPDYAMHNYLLAISGGLDSMVLCHLFHKAGLEFGIAHCNYNLREEESDRDAQLVIEKSIKYYVPIHLRDFDLDSEQNKDPKASTQMLARNLRYQWFNKLCRVHNYNYIVTAHHKEDSIETTIMHFIQGTGISGLTGIPAKNNKVLRPLLNFGKDDLRTYAKKSDVAYEEDSSNQSNVYKRNQIRNQLFPILSEIHPSFRQNSFETITNLAEAKKIYDHSIKRMKSESISEEDGFIKVDLSVIKKSPSPISVLWEILKEYEFHPDQCKNILEMDVKSSGQLFYSKYYKALNDRGFLLLSLNKESDIPSVAFHVQDQTIDFGEHHFKISIWDKNDFNGIDKDPWVGQFDFDKIRIPLRVRNWQEGDRFQPLGLLGHHQKLQDLFNNLQIDRESKKKIPIFTSADKIFWVAGCRIDERFKLSDDTNQILEIKKLK